MWQCGMQHTLLETCASYWPLVNCSTEFVTVDDHHGARKVLHSSLQDFVSLLPNKLITRQGGGPDVINEEMGDGDKTVPVTRSNSMMLRGNTGSGGGGMMKRMSDAGGLMIRAFSFSRGNGNNGGGTNSTVNSMRNFARRQMRSMGKSTLGNGGQAVNETKAEVRFAVGALQQHFYAYSTDM